MGTKKNVDMSSTAEEIKIVKAPEATASTKTVADQDGKPTGKDKVNSEGRAGALGQKTAKTKKAKAAPKKARSKKYQAVRSKLDKSKQYDAFAAIELVKKLSYTKFDGSITAHVQVKEAGVKANLAFPHATGQTVKVAVFSDAVLKKIENNKIDFDVLIATPQDMAKLTKHARVLGPKGLMPNPKNGTLTPKPELKKKELEGGKVTIKTEKKAPLMAVTIGKVSMETKALVENLQAIMKALKDKIVKLSVAASMSPGVKVKVE